MATHLVFPIPPAVFRSVVSVVVQVEDVGSGATERLKREGLLKAAHRRGFDAILVWRRDRWGRSLAGLVTTLEELSALGVGFISVTEALDPTTPARRAMAGLLSVSADAKAKLIASRALRTACFCPRRGKLSTGFAV